ncbi:TetR/AcrR family transcriptional regulator [Mariniblastus fucicola]|uniref:Bacterial regulatory protein, tetR family n=1 Tax=Mariniblastus fucicola TaxID=980251 RepID=A0A5B9PEP0_9BACT|nr:TetR/AcrR family transcriptional regulator [Mariniblastus fucicola]QEG24724.1 Bacterial regulatory protein, tetR family [Mariniblastus fucicola]
MNAKKTPKQKEIELREELLVKTAGQILLTEGFAALSMERLAEELNTAKGTIYNHYPNREELLLAMAVKAINKRQSMFDKASTCQGGSRERILAVGVACELYRRNYPLHFVVESVVRHSAIWDRCTEERRDLMRKHEHRCMSLVSGIVRSAIADGDLTLPGTINPEEMTLSLWALTFGSYVIDMTSPSLKDIGIDSIHRSVRLGALHLLNGYAWQPIWSAAEHDDHMVRVCNAVFPDETPLPHSAF